MPQGHIWLRYSISSSPYLGKITSQSTGWPSRQHIFSLADFVTVIHNTSFGSCMYSPKSGEFFIYLNEIVYHCMLLIRGCKHLCNTSWASVLSLRKAVTPVTFPAQREFSCAPCWVRPVVPVLMLLPTSYSSMQADSRKHQQPEKSNTL